MQTIANEAPSDTPAETPAIDPSADIQQLRQRIDELDAAIIRLWRERSSVSKEVGARRMASGGTRLVLSREQQIIQKFHTELGPIGAQLAILLLRAGRGAL